MCRFCMLNRRNYTRNWHNWNPMPDNVMELESLRGVRIFGRGVREKEGSDEPPEPPWLRAWKVTDNAKRISFAHWCHTSCIIPCIVRRPCNVEIHRRVG